ERVFVVTNSKFFSRFRSWADNLGFAKPLKVIDDGTKSEAARRGAVGDIDFVVRRQKIGGDILVLGGDNIFSAGLKRFLGFARRRPGRPIVGLFDIKDKKAASRYGVVTVDDKSKIVKFEEKPSRPHSSLVAMCVYYFPGSFLALGKEYLAKAGKKAGSDATGNYIGWLSKKTAVYGFVFRGRWYDIGHIDAYKQADDTYTRKIFSICPKISP
ncbi:MAG: sugar phosphate nucleotidyltransferase, partial [Candidatus Omnitrophota bacterium]